MEQNPSEIHLNTVPFSTGLFRFALRRHVQTSKLLLNINSVFSSNFLEIITYWPPQPVKQVLIESGFRPYGFPLRAEAPRFLRRASKTFIFVLRKLRCSRAITYYSAVGVVRR